MSIVREINDMRRFWRTPQSQRRIVFYSEHSDYYPYFEGIIQELVQCHYAPLRRSLSTLVEYEYVPAWVSVLLPEP